MTEVMHHQSDTVFGVHLTQSAMRHIMACLSQKEECKGVRLSISKTGCSGYSYVFDYILAPQENDIIQPIADNFQLYIDKASYPFLKGTTIDFVRQGLNQKFVFDNPNQKGQCGCGESFTV